MVMPGIRVIRVAEAGSFNWRWPMGTEHFERGYDAVVEYNGIQYEVRHGIGERTVYGRSRTHTVTWVNDQVMVEGVEADDFGRSQGLLSLLKVGNTKKHLRPPAPKPSGYEDMAVVVMDKEIRAPRVPASLGVKIGLDDLEGWSRHALLRATALGRILG